MSARLVLLTDGNPFGARLLEGCAARGVRFDAVVRETRADFASCLEDARARGRAGVLGALGRWVVRGRRLAPYAALCRAAGARFVKTGPRNGPAMLADLGALAPEWLILGGIGILAPPLLATARRGVLNAHPGLLPWIRGTGVVGRALERGVAIGATTHLVNAGVDTGDVVERRLLAVTGEERSLAALEERADALAVSMLVDLVVTLAARPEAAPSAVPQARRAKICRWLSPEERAAMDERVRDGLALRLFERWRPVCDASLRLPATLQETLS